MAFTSSQPLARRRKLLQLLRMVTECWLRHTHDDYKNVSEATSFADSGVGIAL
jgi:hypothetical protein